MTSLPRQLTRTYYRKFKSDGLIDTIKLLLIRSQSYLIHILSELPFKIACYTEVDFETISPDNDCVFILGSGSSVNDITDEKWALVEEHADTIGFNHSYKGEFVDVDYHVVREMSYHGVNVLNRLS